ncbi:unnamed protein product, partial [marine sediment metagenome]
MDFKKLMRNHVEYRYDPLTDDQCRINPDRAKRVKQAGGDLRLAKIIEKTKEGCPFCPALLQDPGLHWQWVTFHQ